MDVNTSPIYVTRLVTTEKARPFGLDTEFRVERGFDIAIIGDPSEGFVMMGPPTQVLNARGYQRGDDRIFERQENIPTATYEISSLDVATWAAMGQPLHYKHPLL